MEIGYSFNTEDLSCIAPSRITLPNMTEEASDSTMIDLGRNLSDGIPIHMSSDHGNKKDLYHLVKVLSWWIFNEDKVKQIVLDTDISGETSNETAERINISLHKLDTSTKQLKITRHHADAGGGSTIRSLTDDLRTRNRIKTIWDSYQSSMSTMGSISP